jgi:16S rRNA (uracil1498-N3)-methyltransferase
LTLALALPNKPAKLDMILEHATELGVTGFVLITTDYSNFHHQVRLDRLEKIIMEAIEQSERARLPSLNMVSGLKDYFQNLSEPCFVALERRSASQNILDLNPATSCHILIGPEGGFSPEEIILIDQSSAAPITLGTQILRNETAALIGAGILSLKLQHRLS